MYLCDEIEKKLQEKKDLFISDEVEVISPFVEILDEIDGEKILRKLERAIRTSYQSFDKISQDSHYKIINHILQLHHESTLEHEKITYKVITNRGVTHELVRHRIASYTQESTRYVKYGQKHGYKIIYPTHLIDKSYEDQKKWFDMHCQIAKFYGKLISNGWKAQEARGVLPNDIKTEIVITMNLRELRTFFNLRCSENAHPDIRTIALTLLDKLHSNIPIIYDDLYQKFFNKGI